MSNLFGRKQIPCRDVPERSLTLALWAGPVPLEDLDSRHCRSLFRRGVRYISKPSSYFPGLWGAPARKGIFEAVLGVESGADLFVFPTDPGPGESWVRTIVA